MELKIWKTILQFRKEHKDVNTDSLNNFEINEENCKCKNGDIIDNIS